MKMTRNRARGTLPRFGGVEHNVIQTPELTLGISRLTGIKSAHIAPTLNEGVQPVIIAGDAREESRVWTDPFIWRTGRLTLAGINRYLAAVLVNPFPTGAGGTGPNTDNPKIFSISRIRLQISDPATYGRENTRFVSGVLPTRDWTAVNGGLSTGIPGAQLTYLDPETHLMQERIDLAGNTAVRVPPFFSFRYDSSGSLTAIVSGFACTPAIYLGQTPPNHAVDIQTEGHVTVRPGWMFYIANEDASGTAGGFYEVNVWAHEESPTDPARRQRSV